MSTLPVTNPRTGEVDYDVPIHDREHVEAAAQRLRTQQTAWEASGLEARCEALSRWAEAMEFHETALTDALCIDTGRHLMAHVEAASVRGWIQYWVARAPELMQPLGGDSAMAPSVKYQHQYKPYPLVGVISPWNVPLILGLIDAVPALLAGCSILLKPSEVTPRFAEPLRDTLAEVPELEAVFDIVTGGPATGEALIDSVDAVCFTGSVHTGRIVAARAAENFIPAFLELGGKDPAIVLPSADLDNATNAILRSAAGMTGQACQSLERIYVHESVFEPFLEHLIAKAKAAGINWPDLNQGQIGPFIHPPQGDKVQAQLDAAVAAGATIHCGGVENHGGNWCRPVVVSGVDHDMLLMQEETFGPVMPVMPFADIDEAIALANDSKYGLSGAVFAGSREEGEAVARCMVGGAISVNDASLTAMVHDVEKNSFCQSGMGGSRMGDAGLMRFFRKQAILYQSAPAASLAVMEEAQAMGN
ncbi:MAG: aldehyde dehydrogenase family protein [Pseudomonadota bacterium]